MKLKYIPNILSAIRIALVFAFAYVFFAFYPDGLAAAAGIFILSGITDVVDGRLARRFGWVTQVGKILDPLADKLMQCTALFCLAFKGLVPWWIFVFFAAKELLMGAGAILLFRKKHEIGVSRYFGKAAVVLFYAIVCAILLFGDKMSVFGVNLLCAVAALCAAGALVMYYFNYLKKKKNRNAGESDAGEGANI